MTTVAIYRGTRFVWYLAYIIEALLVTRFVLKLLGANPAASFSESVYAVTSPLLTPFRFVFRADSTAAGVIEWGTLLAIGVYWLVAWALVKLILMNRPVQEEEAARSLEREDYQ